MRYRIYGLNPSTNVVDIEVASLPMVITSLGSKGSAMIPRKDTRLRELVNSRIDEILETRKIPSHGWIDAERRGRMSDIFISYASEDRDRVEPLAKVLEERGWSVWWDRRIPTGKRFAQVIEEALGSARAVVVVWTNASVNSEWVHNEAADAMQRNILLPVFFDEVKIPLEFRRVQAARLIGWHPGASHPGFDQFNQDMSRLLGSPPEKEMTSPELVPPASVRAEQPGSSADSLVEGPQHSLKKAVERKDISSGKNLGTGSLSSHSLKTATIVAGILGGLVVVVFLVKLALNSNEDQASLSTESVVTQSDALSSKVSKLQKELDALKEVGQEKAAKTARVQSKLKSTKAKAAESARFQSELASLEEIEKEAKAKALAKEREIAQLKSELVALKKEKSQAKLKPVKKPGIDRQNTSNQPDQEKTGKDGAPMVLIPSGTFWMGSREGEGYDTQRPRHEVYLDAYYIDTYEVTTSRYHQFMNATGQSTPSYWEQVDLSRDGNKPVVGISWDDAKVYCDWAGKRLPTEAEWEKAARGVEGRTYPWGKEPPSSTLANFNRIKENWKLEVYETRLKTVGNYEKGKTPEGGYDMAGNVLEWVADWYKRDYYRKSLKRNPKSLKRNPKGPSSGERKVLRGGSWKTGPSSLRSANRFRDTPKTRFTHYGVRCAKDAS